MTNDERDEYIKGTHDAMMRIEPMVMAHEKAINGNGNKGLKEKVTIIEAEHTECNKRRAAENPRQANIIALVALVAAVLAVALPYMIK